MSSMFSFAEFMSHFSREYKVGIGFWVAFANLREVDSC